VGMLKYLIFVFLFLKRIFLFRWRNSFIISLVFGIPVMVIMIYFDWVLKSHLDEENQITIVPGISLNNLLLFVLATPVQVHKKILFYIKKLHYIFNCSFSFLVADIFMFSRIKH
jgi:hypothetical protein